MTTRPLWLTRSLEDYRQALVLTVKVFATKLDVTEQTYRRMLEHPETIQMPTRRRVLAVLGLPSPFFVAEFVPRPSPILQARVLAAIQEADANGWVAYDAQTGTPTGECFTSGETVL